MSQAKQARYGTLFVVVGAQHVECALLAGHNWLLDTVHSVQIDSPHDAGMASSPLSPISAATMALEHIESFLAAWVNSNSASQSTVKVHAVRVLIADIFLCQTSVPWSSALKAERSADTFARAQLAAAGFEVEPADVVKLDDAPYAQPRMALAYPAVLLSALTKLANGFDTKLVSVLPLSIAAWSALPQSNRGKVSALALYDEGATTVAFGAGRLTDVVVRGCDEAAPSPDAALLALSAHWSRMRMRDPQLAQVDQLAVLSPFSPSAFAQYAGQDLFALDLPSRLGEGAPSSSLHLAALSQSRCLSLDAQSPVPAMTVLRWGVASVAFALAGIMALQAFQVGRQAEALATQAASVRSAETSATHPRTASWTRDEIVRVQAVNAAVRELNLPISALMRALQPPRDIRVALLSVDVMGGTTSAEDQNAGVKIVAEARTGADMARYVGFVSERKPFAGAYLTHHEINESASERPYRFTLEAAWASN